MNSNRKLNKTLLALALTGAALVFMPRSNAASQDPAAALKTKLHGSQYKDVQVNVDQSGLATLSGTVPLYENKEDADKQAHKAKGVTAVRNNIQVAGNVPDAEIMKKLGPQLAYSREGYGNVFDAIALNVQDGIVTLSGHAHDYPSRDAAVGYAATTPGVRDVVDNIQVDPVSEMDMGIRMRVARAIYGDPVLEKYAINPVRPIRISVQNGNVSLYGAVDDAQDRQMAYMRASQVPGIFSVKDYIQVQGQPAQQNEGQEK
jgi:hyperosmotically inducible periplasmic protein